MQFFGPQTAFFLGAIEAALHVAAEAPQTYKIMVRNESGSVGSGDAQTGEALAMHRCHAFDDVGENALRL